jgi:GNAT superfamily N-acetyltransferase
MNRVFALGFARPVDAELLDSLVDVYRSARVPRFLLHWSPLAEASATVSFGALGFKPISRMAKLYRRTDVTVTASTGFHIRRIGIESAALYGEVVATGHGDPPELAAAHAATVGCAQWRHYLAYDENHAVAGATLFWSGEFAWCGFSSTLPSHRSRGAHSALLARRIRDAVEIGCSWIICETAENTATRPNPAYRNMRRAGFELAYFRDNLLYKLAR